MYTDKQLPDSIYHHVTVQGLVPIVLPAERVDDPNHRDIHTVGTHFIPVELRNEGPAPNAVMPHLPIIENSPLLLAKSIQTVGNVVLADGDTMHNKELASLINAEGPAEHIESLPEVVREEDDFTNPKFYPPMEKYRTFKAC